MTQRNEVVQRNDLVVPEDVVLEACGEPGLPAFGLIEQLWETDPIPPERIPERAGEAVDRLDFSAVPDGGVVEEAREREDLRVVREPEPIEFDGGEFVAPSPHET